MTGQHRAPGMPRLTGHALTFVPRHCAGASCMHAHPDEQPLPTLQFQAGPA